MICITTSKLLLHKSPDTIILNVGTNDCVSKFSFVVLDKILKFKTLIYNSLPHCKIIISNIIDRTDEGNAYVKVQKFEINIVNNSNIEKECLGKKGLHLIERGSGKLAINFVNKISGKKSVHLIERGSGKLAINFVNKIRSL